MYLYNLVVMYVLFVKIGREGEVLPILSCQPGVRCVGWAVSLPNSSSLPDKPSNDQSNHDDTTWRIEVFALQSYALSIC